MKSGINAKSVVLSFFVSWRFTGPPSPGIEYPPSSERALAGRFPGGSLGGPERRNRPTSIASFASEDSLSRRTPDQRDGHRPLRPRPPAGAVRPGDLRRPHFSAGSRDVDLFGHEIEILPRVLIINKKTVPWESGATLELWPTNKPAVPPPAAENPQLRKTGPGGFPSSFGMRPLPNEPVFSLAGSFDERDRPRRFVV